jgi:hypothetical protein
MPIAPKLGNAHAAPLIQVTWDASPELEEFLRFIGAYAKSRFSNSLAERLALASAELLDNALRYGSVARAFCYSLDIRDGRIGVEVQNTTVPMRIEMLTTQLRRLEKSPEKVYAYELERSMVAGARRSMLGLARIRHEAAMELEMSLDGLDVTVRAHCPR